MILSTFKSALRSIRLELFPALLLPGLFLGSSVLSAQSQQGCPIPTRLIGDLEGPIGHVRYLADDALAGRETGSPGAYCAGDYIASVFEAEGLVGAGEEGSFYQVFQVQMGSQLVEGNALALSDEPLPVGESWVPFGFSGAGTVEGSLVYGGPGVSRPGSDDDAYAHLDLNGKIVVVEGGDPHGSGAGTMAGDPHFKATVAAGRGAAAMLLLLPEGQSLPDPVTEERPAVKIPAIAISGEASEAVRAAAEAGRHATVTAAIEPRMVDARNVVAMIPGSDPTLAREVVIVGAHYDHLGMGGDGSLAPDEQAVHNGADDNASGTAALMEVAKAIQASGRKPARTVLFLAFTGEEKGLWGSAHYVKEPLLPLENTVAMINMDMVGRLRENTLTVYGTGTAMEWPSILRVVNGMQDSPMELASITDGFGPSDHSSFYGAKVPVLMLFTNTHSEYHRPEDDWDLINRDGLERVASFAADLVGEIAGSEEADVVALTYVEGAGNPHGAMASDQASSSSGGPGYGAYMGTIPDMTPQELGVRITGVREESPAETGGLQGGDVIVEFGGKEITDLYAYTYALREHKPGDEVQVVVLREGERLSLTVVLGSR